ncbi:MAG: cell division protein FtsL [Casimicrobiaceae bacterium]
MLRANIMLALLVWVSAFALVTSQYRVRELTIEINRARDLAYQLENDWSRLRIAQSRLSTATRVEQVARGQLGLDLPEPSQIRLLDLQAVAREAAEPQRASELPQVAQHASGRSVP